MKDQIPDLLFPCLAQRGCFLSEKNVVQLLSGQSHGVRLILHAEHADEEAVRGPDFLSAHQVCRRAPESGAARQLFGHRIFHDRSHIQEQARAVIQKELRHSGIGGGSGKLADFFLHHPVLLLPHRPLGKKILFLIKQLRRLHHLFIYISKGHKQCCQRGQMGQACRRVLPGSNIISILSQEISGPLLRKRRLRLRQGRLHPGGPGRRRASCRCRRCPGCRCA